MTKSKGKQHAAVTEVPHKGSSSGIIHSYRLPETNSTPLGSVITSATPVAPTVQSTSPAAACSSAAPKLSPGNASPTSAFATAGALMLWQQLQQRGAVANNHAVNQQYYSLQQCAAEYACVATEMRVRHNLEREEQRKRAQRASACALNTAACQVTTPAASPAPVMPVAAAPTSVIPAAVPTAVNAPGTTSMDVDHNATPVAEISPDRVIAGDLERVVVQTATVSSCPGLAAMSCPIAGGFIQLNAKLQGIEESQLLPDLLLLQQKCLLYSLPGNNVLINEFSNIFEGSASSPVTPTALAAAAAAAATVSVPVPVSAPPVNTTEDISNTDKDTLESAILPAERFGSKPVSRSSSPHAEP
ncbi:hypothetical protein DFJ73DRAFT_766782 [Zopfochytrium polystomum]|nr:hypothetical protein DFJ73DRAFT_766782 [Zopfochytrium polystomum]